MEANRTFAYLRMDTEGKNVPVEGSSRGGQSAGTVALAATLAGLAVAVWLAVVSDGVYQDDDICHYLYARDAWGNVGSMWHSWARPGYTIPAMFVAHYFGLFGCRIFSALQTAAIAYLAYLIARRIVPRGGVAIALAPALVWVQPLAMTLALTTLTETTAALYMAAAVWLYMRGSRVWACLAAGMLCITRYEALGLSPILAAAVFRDAFKAAQRNWARALKTWWVWACALVMIAPMAIYMAVVVLAELPPDASPLQFTRNDVAEYGWGDWDHHLVNWLVASGCGVLALCVAGAVSVPRRAWLPLAMAGGYVGLHTLIYHYGIVASGGYPRFLVPICGPVAALAACGLWAAWRGRGSLASAAVFATVGAILLMLNNKFPEIVRRQYVTFPILVLAFWAAVGLMTTGMDRPGPRAWFGRFAAVGAALLAVAQVVVDVRPLSLAREPLHSVVVDAVHTTQQPDLATRPVITQHILARFLRDNTDGAFGNVEAIRMWQAAVPGTLFLWENKYCFKPHEMDSTYRLHEEMFRLGRLISRKQSARAIAEVFERLPDAHTQPGGTYHVTTICSPYD